MSHHRIAAALAAMFALAGCAMELESPGPSSLVTPAPANPTTPVQAAALPPLDTVEVPGAGAAVVVPKVEASTPAAAAPGATAAPATAAGPTGTPAEPPPRVAAGAQAAGLNGKWTLSANGRACAITLQEPPSSRAGWVTSSPDCPDVFAGAASWTLSGSTLFLYDTNTRAIGRLAAIAANRFEGQTAQGAPVSLER